VSHIRSHLAELNHYRDLLFSVGIRTIKVRYKQSYLGLAWAIIQPIATMIVFTIVFGRWAKVDTGGIPYEVSCLAALLPWTFFNAAVGNGSQVLVGNANLIRKAYFPREILLIASVFGAFFDTLIAFVVFVAMTTWYGHPPGIEYLYLIPVMLVAATFALGVILILAPINVFYRDVRHAVPLLLNLWLFASPVAYLTVKMVPSQWWPLYALNPLVGIVETFRWAAFPGEYNFVSEFFIISAAVAVGLCVIGYFFFKRAERTIADLI
jgi:lipopolysaccharide transport system permease protein